MNPDITIREATRDDLDAIARLNRGAVPAVGDVDEWALWRLVEQSSQTLVAVDDGVATSLDGEGAGVVAFLIAFGPGADYDSPNYRFFADRYPSFRYVDRVVVEPSYVRRGIGAGLYDRLEAEATEAGVEVLTAEVNVRPPNQTSLAFHAARGFAGVGEQDTEGGAKRVRLLVRELAG